MQAAQAAAEQASASHNAASRASSLRCDVVESCLLRSLRDAESEARQCAVALGSRITELEVTVEELRRSAATQIAQIEARASYALGEAERMREAAVTAVQREAEAAQAEALTAREQQSSSSGVLERARQEWERTADERQQVASTRLMIVANTVRPTRTIPAPPACRWRRRSSGGTRCRRRRPRRCSSSSPCALGNYRVPFSPSMPRAVCCILI